MVDLKISSKIPDNYLPGKLDVRFSGEGLLETLTDDKEIYEQNLIKASLDAARENTGYGIDIASFRGQKDLLISRTLIQYRAANTVIFMNRYYPINMKLTSCNIFQLSEGILVRLALDKTTIELVVGGV